MSFSILLVEKNVFGEQSRRGGKGITPLPTPCSAGCSLYKRPCSVRNSLSIFSVEPASFEVSVYVQDQGDRDNEQHCDIGHENNDREAEPSNA